MSDDNVQMSGTAEAAVSRKPHEVRLLNAARTISCATGQDVLNASIQANAGWLMIGCRGGGCGVCRVAVRSGNYETGRVNKRYVASAGTSRRFALACRLYRLSDLVIELAAVVNPRPGDSAPADTGGSLWQSKV